MRCHEIEVLLATCRDLSVAQEQQIRSHVAGCERCAALLRREERTDRVLRSLPSSNALPPAWVQPTLEGRIGPRRSGFTWRPVIKVSFASLLVLIGITYALWDVLPLTSTINQPQPAATVERRIEATASPEPTPTALPAPGEVLSGNNLYISLVPSTTFGLDFAAASIRVVDPATKNTIASWKGYEEVVVSRDGRRAYVANPTHVAAIDTATGEELWRTEVVSQVQWLYPSPSRLTLSPDERTLYVTSTNNIVDQSTMTKLFWLQPIDTTTGVLHAETIELPGCGTGSETPHLATPPSGDQLYALCRALIINTTTRELTPLFTNYDTTQQDGRWPPFSATGAGFSSDGQTLYLGDGIALYRVKMDRPNEFVRVDWAYRSEWNRDIYVQRETMFAMSGDGTRIVLARTFGTDSGFPSSTEFQVYDTQRMEEIGNFIVERAMGPYTLTLNHDGTRAYVSMGQQQQPHDTLVEIDVNSGQVIAETQYPDEWIMRMRIQP
jgi:DNA-binding beta-propeller fold protein YncE